MNSEIMKDLIRYTGIKERPPFQAFFEEDILVPDIKPDVVRICSSRVVPKLIEKENYGGSLKLGGDLYLEVVYTPSSSENGGVEVSNTRIPFRHEITGEEFFGELEIVPKVEHLEVSVINERKLRMKTVISFDIKEYEDVEKNIFKGFRDEKIEMLQQEIGFTDVCEHKKDYIEVKDEVKINDGMPEIDCVLKSDFRVVETYRQISGEKMIISGCLYYDIMYLSEAVEPEPVIFKGKTEFTQFVKLESDDFAGSDVVMSIDDIKIVPKKDEEDNMTIFEITVGVSTRVDVFRERLINIVEDAYHCKDILDLEKDELPLMRYVGRGVEDINIREKVEFDRNEDVERVAFVSGEVFATGGEVDEGKFNIEGVIIAEFLYCCFEEKGLRSFSREIPFRGVIDVPGLKRGMELNVDFVIKELKAEKINDYQIEISGEVAVSVKCSERKSVSCIKNAGVFDNMTDADDNSSRLIMYVARNNNSLWDIGKRYRTSIDDIKKVNGLDEGLSSEFVVEDGEKLLIWA